MSAGFNRRLIVTYDERQVAEAREHLLPEIEKTRRTGSSDYWRVRQDIEGLKDMPYNAVISKPLADALKALDAARLSAQREWEAAHPAEMAEADRLYRQERERVLAANAHDHFLAEQDCKEGY